MIVAERKLVNVSLKVAPTNVMMRAIHRPLQLAPESFNRVGVDIAAHVFVLAVVYCAVLVAPLRGVAVNRQFVGVERGGNIHIARDVPENVVCGHGVNDLRDYPAIAFHNPDYRSLSSGSAPALARPHAANISFVRFDDAHEFRRSAVAHEFADLVIHPPSRLVGDAELPLQFLCGHPVLARSHQENGEEPRLQTRAGLMEDRASGGIDVFATPSARIATTASDVMERGFLAALRASQPIRPPCSEHKIEAGLIVRELRLELS